MNGPLCENSHVASVVDGFPEQKANNAVASVVDGFPAQKANNAKRISISISWIHHITDESALSNKASLVIRQHWSI